MYWFRNCHDQMVEMLSVPPWCFTTECVPPISVRKSVNFPPVEVPQGSCGKLELDASSPREISGLFIHQSAPLFLPYERLRSFCHCFLSHSLSLGICFQCFPPCSRFVVPFPIVAYLSSIPYPPGNPKLLPEKVKVLSCILWLHLLLNTLRATSTNESVIQMPCSFYIILF